MLKTVLILFLTSKTYSQKPDYNLVRRKYKITHTGTLYTKYTISETKIRWVSMKRCCHNYQCTIQSINCKPLDHRDVQRWPERYKHFVCDIFKQRTSELHPCAMKLRQSNFTDMAVTNDWGMLESVSLIKIWYEQRMSVRREFGLGKCYLHRFA